MTTTRGSTANKNGAATTTTTTTTTAPQRNVPPPSMVLTVSRLDRLNMTPAEAELICKDQGFKLRRTLQNGIKLVAFIDAHKNGDSDLTHVEDEYILYDFFLVEIAHQSRPRAEAAATIG